MSLDFTALNNIIPTGQCESHSGETGSGALNRLSKEKQERENTRQMYDSYQQNIQRAGMLRSEIIKGIQRGEDPLAILLKALECISLMTGDTAMYSQSKEDLLAVYGWGLGQPAPLKKELESAKKRLAMLTRPEIAQTAPDAQKRIQGAIEAHTALIGSLEQALARGQT